MAAVFNTGSSQRHNISLYFLIRLDQRHRQWRPLQPRRSGLCVLLRWLARSSAAAAAAMGWFDGGVRTKAADRQRKREREMQTERWAEKSGTRIRFSRTCRCSSFCTLHRMTERQRAKSALARFGLVRDSRAVDHLCKSSTCLLLVPCSLGSKHHFCAWPFARSG